MCVRVFVEKNDLNEEAIFQKDGALMLLFLIREYLIKSIFKVLLPACVMSKEETTNIIHEHW